MSKICRFCYFSRIDDKLTDDNDYFANTIDFNVEGFRIMFCSGWGKPPRIESETWDSRVGLWIKVGQYYPKFCPECGRKIDEYKKMNEEV